MQSNIDHKISHKNNILIYFIAIIIILAIEGVLLALLYIPSIKTIEITYQNNSQSISARAEYAIIEAKKLEPVYIKLPGASEIRAIVENYHSSGSLWLLVNKTHPISSSYVPSNLISPNLTKAGDIKLRSDIVEKLTEMFNAASTRGVDLKIASGYRSYEYQKTLFSNLEAGVGTTTANQSIALPGQSEHQTGLALDIASSLGTCYIEECFSGTQSGQWLADNSYLYGFILRYPKGKEDITQYVYEPWHFRYVGPDLAKALHDSGLTLEEAYPYTETALSKLIENKAIRI